MAKDLGWFNVDEMLNTAPAGTLARWAEFYRIEATGDVPKRWDVDDSTLEAFCD